MTSSLNFTQKLFSCHGLSSLFRLTKKYRGARYISREDHRLPLAITSRDQWKHRFRDVNVLPSITGQFYFFPQFQSRKTETWHRGFHAHFP